MSAVMECSFLSITLEIYNPLMMFSLMRQLGALVL
jgi:hypothetical protein